MFGHENESNPTEFFRVIYSIYEVNNEMIANF